ncbi:hypothetical protein [Lysobacter enzymogenes]|uniref:hypothetical protein n=1 Tax=Lysobacter enzymogenes TaxID=69 RepID=UPI0022655004|nr:hypothetical protein [Lysobacter enzymogenes]UZW59838.1 hypothetical protein BV903_021570 [Lysobacter enzymogenes]
MNVNTCPRIFLLPPEPSEPPSFEASVQPGRASYSIVSFRQPPVETVMPYRAPFDPTTADRAAHLTASFQFVNTHRNRCFLRPGKPSHRLPGRASYSMFSIRQYASKTAGFARSRMR